MAAEPGKTTAQAGFLGYQPMQTANLSSSEIATKDPEVTMDTTDNEELSTADTNQSKELVSKTGIKFGPYSWFVLTIILGIRVLYQWQRSIFSYCYGYKGLGEQANNAMFAKSNRPSDMCTQLGSEGTRRELSIFLQKLYQLSLLL